MRNVRERAAVNQRGRAFKRLNEIRLNRVFEQQRKRAGDFQIVRRDNFAVNCVSDDNFSEP